VACGLALVFAAGSAARRVGVRAEMAA
jgi:hypothetical protein